MFMFMRTFIGMHTHTKFKLCIALGQPAIPTLSGKGQLRNHWVELCSATCFAIVSAQYKLKTRIL